MTEQEKAIWRAIKRIERRLTFAAGGVPPTLHAETHAPAGSDPITFAGAQIGWTVVIGDGVNPITTGFYGFDRVPFDFTPMGVVLFGDASGSIEVDLYKDIYANFPPDAADSIVASAKPTLASAQNSKDVTLTGWDVAWLEDDALGVNVDTVDGVLTQVTMQVFGIRT